MINPEIIQIRAAVRPIKEIIDQAELAYLKKIIELTKGNKVMTAQVLAISRPTLDKILLMHKISL